MADFPLVCCFEGDYGYKVLVVDDGDTIDTVAQKAASKLVGVVVPRPPVGSQLRVRVQGSDHYLPRSATVRAAGLTRMDPIEILPVMP
jgi:hypothetical protein